MAYIDGDDFINGAILSYQEGNRMKNNWRGAAAPANIQPGMIFSKSPNDKLYHAGVASAQEEILQLSRSADVSPTFLYETLLGRNLKTWWNFEDFIFGPTNFNIGLWQPKTGGTPGSQIYAIAPTAQRFGITSLDVGTQFNGWASISSGGEFFPLQFLFGAGVYTIEADIYLPNLSTVTETYTARFGFGDVYNGDFVDGAYFEYSDAGATPNWYRCTASNGTRTKISSGVAAIAGEWIRLKAVVNAAGTSVEYFINGVSVGSNTTDIPVGAGRQTGAVLSIFKSAGTTPRVINIDWAWIHVNLTTTR